ncbi:putative cryptochrome DASH, mitochondrial [Erysiphe necator]|nr:putative cryptochrome DASH, mitochondrial [Erysiphe necator]
MIIELVPIMFRTSIRTVGFHQKAISYLSNHFRKELHSIVPKMAEKKRLLIYVMRRDLRVADNPILFELATNGKKHKFTHLLPVYVFSAQQIEVSGFIDGEEKCPFPEARSRIGGFWRCGPHRAKFISESLEDLKESLEEIGSSLCIRVGMIGSVIEDMIAKFATENFKVAAVWMVGEDASEELSEETAVKNVCRAANVGFKIWADEKYLVDDRDLPFDDIKDLPDVFTSFRKSVEPLRTIPRISLPTPTKGSLPAYPETIPPQQPPFNIPSSFIDIKKALLKPLKTASLISHPPEFPVGASSSFPLQGGCTHAEKHLRHLLLSSCITNYKDTRNGLLGVEYSTKLSAYLALGCVTSRQIHHGLLSLENGTDSSLSSVEGYGAGENSGTKATRFELLWRDYMRLCTRKFGPKLFCVSGFRNQKEYRPIWNSPSKPLPGSSINQVQEIVERFLNGTTGMGLIDAAQRELYLTGFTSNRTRQNVASFLAKHLKIDWRIGAEWYESMLVDHDVSSNWGNWQYVSGVGNDPRGEDRVFNPVKQAIDYDPHAEYVMTWCPELRAEGLEVTEIFQPWTIPESKRESLRLKGLISVEKPLRKIQFGSQRKSGGQSHYHQNQRNGNNRGRDSRRGKTQVDDYGGRGYGSSKAYTTKSKT